MQNYDEEVEDKKPSAKNEGGGETQASKKNAGTTQKTAATKTVKSKWRRNELEMLREGKDAFNSMPMVRTTKVLAEGEDKVSK